MNKYVYCKTLKLKSYNKSMENNPEHYIYKLYMSPKCPYSTQFIQAIKEYSMYDYFKIIDIQKCKEEEIRYMTHVPTIIIERGKQYVGKDAFQWLEDHLNRPKKFEAGNGNRLNLNTTNSSLGSSFGKKNSSQLQEMSKQVEQNISNGDLDARLQQLMKERENI